MVREFAFGRRLWPVPSRDLKAVSFGRGAIAVENPQVSLWEFWAEVIVSGGVRQ
ncbi:hypothetical protein [Baaleninema sp.]|uniref:hypothetical protein n=1 Tax=Baaleninema sp. TaxID=3101197 RepID=UPI003CFCB469